MKADQFALSASRRILRRTTLCLAVGLTVSGWLSARDLLAQTAPTEPPPSAVQPAAAQPAQVLPTRGGPAAGLSGTEQLKGRTVESVRVLGNTEVSTAIILNLVRTREGGKFDPETVAEDYQRIYGLKKFSNVEAKVEPTATGVIVAFIVSEQRQLSSIVFRGNYAMSDLDLRGVIDVRTGESIDRFRISLAKGAIEQMYRDKNYPFAHVDLDNTQLAQGVLIFSIVEGPNVRVRKVNFVGNRSFTGDRLKGVVQTKSWIWIFRHGNYDPETVEDDIALIRRYYVSKGFFDARIGRKLIWSADNSELQIDYVVEEGTRYTVDRVTFKGNASLSEAELRKNLKLTEGSNYDADVLARDLREVVRAYSPFGFIYQPNSNDPNYLQIGDRRDAEGPVKKIYRRDAGKVELVYDISEGKAFHVGRILVSGNTKTQDKVVLRELRITPGQLYNSGEVQDATDRLRGTPYFSRVQITPVGDDPQTRDLLVEANDKEARTATFNIGAGINSNGGVGANVTYEQRNFDIMNWPTRWQDAFNGQAFVGAGQTFRVSLEPGTTQTNASIRFTDPWVFDQPYSFTSELYLRTRVREHYDDNRLGGRVSLGKRFNYIYSGLLTLRGERVDINSIQDKPIRAQEILDAAGASTLTSIGLQFKRDTTNRGLLPSKGTTTTFGLESAGALGGDYTFQKFSLGFDGYQLLSEDLLDRKTILELHADTGYIAGASPFFERYYGGGIGSIRGFKFRGVSPRSGPDDDVVGGDFILTGTAQVTFPVVGDSLRGVVFGDAGTVNPDFEVGKIRTAVGAGIRLTLPILGQTPIAIDFAIPVTRDGKDETQFISFSLGISR